MITLLEDLNNSKAYKEETLYLAASLCDRYLVNVAIINAPNPCLIKLAVVCTLLAAKLEQPIHPSYSRMIKLVADDWNFPIEKKELIDLEMSVIHLLDFDLSYVGPI